MQFRVGFDDGRRFVFVMFIHWRIQRAFFFFGGGGQVLAEGA